MTPLEQRQRNANGALTVLCDAQKAKIKEMTIDLNRYRDRMEQVEALLTTDSLKSSRKEAAAILRAELDHRQRQREPRKTRAAQ